MNTLLLDEYPLIILKGLATKIGLNEAIMVQQIHYWLIKNEERSINYHDGRYWTYNSYDNWQKEFPFFSVSTIRRTIKSLESQGLIIVGNYNKLKIDRTRWYTIDYQKLKSIDNSPCVQNEQMDCSKWTDSHTKMNRPLPETTAETNNKDKRLHHLQASDDFVSIYLTRLDELKEVKHPRVSDEQEVYIQEVINLLKQEGITTQEFSEAVEEHLLSLKPENNGSILYMFEQGYNYFGLDTRKQVVI